MHTAIFALLAMGAGCCIALQASANGKLRHNIDSPLFTSYFSILGTILTATIAMAVLRPPLPALAAVRETPWWNWIGGPLGAMIVLAGAALTRELGAAVFISLVVGGQLLCSLALDHFALMGLDRQTITPGRVVGALLVVAGVACIKFW
jgi:transporter family-2 protein